MFLSCRSWKHLVSSWVCSQVWISALGNLGHRSLMMWASCRYWWDFWVTFIYHLYIFVTQSSSMRPVYAVYVENCSLLLFPLQKQNIPSDYEIPVSYIPKEVVCMKKCYVQIHIGGLILTKDVNYTCTCISRLARAGWC